eukprot:gnl/MRDRNA2_/MRDRNA2_127512_c0_seq1.p1 gnl/MRDRNA2_/MRDRNA2_127512_c0~~gnl/MRDRNA2_/MRDRNA2_127512_c0_seq1.p1  ORF type:complete len:342 (+),score=33.08 gnl/MRDRNA2_/MRDRNA2_127512_c0_seq1:87-1028(+)
MFALSSTLLQVVNAKTNGPVSWADPKVVFSYGVFLIGAMAIHYSLHSDTSSVLTLSAGLQCLAFYILAMKVRNRRATLGVSGKMLILYATTFCLRLSSTMWLNGYLPIDETGDWAYQALELSSLAMVAYCIRSVFLVHRGTYQQKHDSLPLSIGSLVMGCIFIAVAIHPNLDRLPAFDIFWASSCYLEAFAMLPQLYMFLHKGVEIEPLTGHFVVLSTLSRACSLAFWYRGFKDLGDSTGFFNMQGWMVMGSHIVQLLFSVNALLLCTYCRVYGDLVAISAPTSVAEGKPELSKNSDVENQSDDASLLSVELY